MEPYVILKGDENDKPAINQFFYDCLIAYSNLYSIYNRVLVCTLENSHSDLDYEGNFNFGDDLYCFETNPRNDRGGVNYYFRITKGEDIITNPESLLWFFKRINILELEQVKQNPEREMEVWRMMNEAQRRLSEHYLASLNKMQSLLNSALSECCDMWKEKRPILNSEVDPEEFKLTRIFTSDEREELSEEFWKVAYQKQEDEDNEEGSNHIKILEETMLEFCKTYNEREYGN